VIGFIKNLSLKFLAQIDKKKDLKTNSLYGQELLDLIARKIQEYCISPHKGIIADSSVRHIARKISIQDGYKE